MLILKRNPQQTIMIGDNIAVTVVSTEAGEVSLAIHAPKEVPVYRLEIYRRRKSQEARSRVAAAPSSAQMEDRAHALVDQ